MARLHCLLRLKKCKAKGVSLKVACLPLSLHAMQLFDASRMAQRAQRAVGPTPSPFRLVGLAAADATPMAHPEPALAGGEGADEEDEGAYGSYPASASVRRSGTPATSMLSTSSFSPPRQLVLLAVRPLGRVSCRRPGGCLPRWCAADAAACGLQMQTAHMLL